MPNGGCLPDTKTSQSHSACSLDFRESQIPAGGLQCGAYTAPRIVPLPRCMLNSEMQFRNLGNYNIRKPDTSLHVGEQAELVNGDSEYLENIFHKWCDPDLTHSTLFRSTNIYGWFTEC